jgi:hypothetical protein
VTLDDRHVGRYERASVARQGDRMTLTYRATGDRVAFAEEPVEEYELRPAAADGDQFVVRDEPGQPWVPATFTTLADGTPYLFTGGRVTPRSR